MKRLSLALALLFFLCALGTGIPESHGAPAAPAPKPEGIALSKSLDTFFEAYCYNCHDADTMKADLNLEGLTRTIGSATDAEHWQDILDQLNAGEMPPKNKKQPTAEDLAKAVGDLTESLQAAQELLKDSGGQIALRRLNKREYVATIKDLMGIRLLEQELPDDASGRFDTIGQDQSLSPMQLERYFTFAQDVARTALHWSVQPRAKPKTYEKDCANTAQQYKQIWEIFEKIKIVHETDQTWQEVGLTEEQWKTHNWGTERYPRDAEWRQRKNMAKFYIENLDYHDRGRMLSIQNLTSDSMGVRIPRDARAHYRLRMQAGVMDGVKRRRAVRITVPQEYAKLGGPNGRLIGSFLIRGSIDEPSTHEMTWHPSFRPNFRPDYKKSFGNVVFLEDKRGGPGMGQLYQHFYPFEPDVPDAVICLVKLEAEGPFYEPETPFEQLVNEYKVASASDETLDGIAREFLEKFAQEAFRGKAVPAELIDQIHAYYQARRSEGNGFHEAIVDPLALILSSTRFLYLLEPAKEESRKLDAISLANRLSYFLWSGPPDDELQRLAADASILDPNVLSQQVDRMLADPRAAHFYRGFMSQWMHLKRLDQVGLDSRLHLHRTDGLIESSKQEPVEFFRTLVQENLAASNLIDSDFVMVNGVLALKYGLTDHFKGDGFQKLKLPADSPRGGVITQSAFLSIGTMGNRTSPVIRGALVKEILLNDPPPPPPPNVPELVHAGTDPLASVRSLVTLHQEKTQCASCHARFDFIGLGLENFGPLGLWRDEELVTEAQIARHIKKAPKKIYPIDASGNLPNGETFEDVHGMKAALMKEQRAVAGSIFEGLYCYALGRDVSFTDQPLIESALDELEAEQYPIRSMIHRIVTSKPFLEY
jgi:hypothetical protein